MKSFFTNDRLAKKPISTIHFIFLMIGHLLYGLDNLLNLVKTTWLAYNPFWSQIGTTKLTILTFEL